MLLVISCGYRPVRGTVPGGSDEIHVPSVINKTPHPALAGPLTASVRRQLAKDGLHVVDKGHSAARLHITIYHIESKPGMLTARDDQLIPLDSVWRIRIEAHITDPKGALIAGPEKLSVEGRAVAAGNPLFQESQGNRRLTTLLDELARAISRQMFGSNRF